MRILQLGLAAGAVTAMSLVMFPKSWIFFGILHFLLVASLLGLVLVRVPLLALAAGLLILMFYNLGLLTSLWPFDRSWGWLPNNTEDYVPFFPWLGVAFLGIAGASYLPLESMQKRLNWMPWFMRRMGQHGLLIYLIHQPIMFAGFYALAWLRGL